ncbi:MAG TPA: hypothetical protein VN258_15755 [Mobilitalea sp.]|nr:hypothetical protein [Mobilitalea sp.]
MKLKYYLRGLGIGIVLTTLIFTLDGYKKMSDEDIKASAMKLGMVMKDDTNSNLDKVLDEIPTGLPTPTPAISSKPELTQAPTQKPTAAPTPTITPTKEATPKPTEKPTNTSEVSQTDQKEITFTIKSGMSSREVSELMKELGLVDDANKFNHYIAKAGKENVIQGGVFQVIGKPTYEQLLNILTTNY